ncbi:hypothetical protein BCR32DRAFT_291580 [Anaeromyces robustus]|uniref:GH18 domain-containing protein n=1 Tax=Anaeromyces robustus TaxID=1754192 RepID=A0A1Y1XF93_9FUNG|nr:hypothetical protein BCR32DRAFT_291580 [Anaeromyces robustus]|eukprot:ORX84086.1 hypothetical protein BCR32DRAFT_291580 [Anaeromyces robustus]
MKSKLLLLIIFISKIFVMSIPLKKVTQNDVILLNNGSTCSELNSKGRCSLDCPCLKAEQCCSKHGYCGTTSNYCNDPLVSITTEKTTITTKKNIITTTIKKTTTTNKITTTKKTTTKKITTTTIDNSSINTYSANAGIVIYLPNYNLGSSNILDFDFTNIDVVNYSFFRLNDNGEPYSTYNSVDFKNKAIYYLNNDIKKKYPKLRTVLSFGGGSGSGNFGSVLNTDAKIKTVAKNIKNIINELKFDGVDIDWEFPNNETEIKNLLTLLKKLRSYLGNNKILTISASASPSKYQGYSNKFVKYVNWFNIMTYNYAGSWHEYTGYNSPLYSPSKDLNGQKSCHETTSIYINEGVPASRLVIGGAFYGREWKVNSSTNNGYNQVGTTNGCGAPGYTNGSWSYKALREQNILSSPKVATSPWIRTWHSDVKSPTLFNPNTNRYISYDDTDSMCERAAYVKKNKFAGVMVWEVGLDYKRELLNRLIRCYQKY